MMSYFLNLNKLNSSKVQGNPTKTIIKASAIIISIAEYI
jgi:hypothetical protein